MDEYLKIKIVNLKNCKKMPKKNALNDMKLNIRKDYIFEFLTRKIHVIYF